MPDSSLDGRVALITGASRGIGLAIAEELASRGARVVITGRKQPDLDASVQTINSRYPGAAVGVPGHAGREAEIEHLVKSVMDKFAEIDILVVNAGTNPYMGTIIDIEMPAWDKVFEVNLRGAFLLIQRVVRSWMFDHGGSIVTIASTAGLHPSAGLGVYGVSKAALIHLTKQLAKELGDRNIRVNAVAPGLIETRFASALWTDESRASVLRALNPMGRIGQPSEVAKAVAFLASDDASYVNGAVLTIDGGSAFV